MLHCFSDLHMFRTDPLGFLLEKGSSAHNSLIQLYLGKKTYLIVNPALVSGIKDITVGVTSKGSVFHKLKFRTESRESRSLELKEAAYTQFMSGLVPANIEQITAIVRKNIFKLAGRNIFNANEIMAPLALHIMSTLIFGHSTISDSDEHAFIKAVKFVEAQMQHPINRVLPGVEADCTGYAEIQASRKIIRAILKRLREKALPGSLFRAMEKSGADSKELDNEILAVLLIGYYFIGGSAPWTLYFMAVHDGLQEKLAQEAEAISDSVGELSFDGLSTAKTSVALTHEVLRLYPPVWWSSRTLETEKTIEGCRLFPGTSLIVSPWQLGRDARYWHKPDEFNLHRNYNTPAFCPFGAGLRANISSSIATSILQIITLNFSVCYRLSYKSRYPAPPPLAAGALMPPKISLSM